MERMKPPNLRHFPQQMEKFLLTGSEQGVDTYQMEITKEIGENSIIWIGFFPNAFGFGRSRVEFGILNEYTPVLPSLAKSIVQHSKFSSNPQPINLTLNLGKNQYPEPQNLTPEMPSVGIIFLPKKTREDKEKVYLRIASAVIPVGALRTVWNELNKKSLN